MWFVQVAAAVAVDSPAVAAAWWLMRPVHSVSCLASVADVADVALAAVPAVPVAVVFAAAILAVDAVAATAVGRGVEAAVVAHHDAALELRVYSHADRLSL